MRINFIAAAAALSLLSACAQPVDDGSIPATPKPPAEAVPEMPPPVASPSTDGIFTYAGVGTAGFGADESSVRKAWAGTLEGAPTSPEDCYLLVPAPRAARVSDTAFMFEARRFSRVDVNTASIPAPGGGRVGMRQEDIQTRYPGQVEVLPHKYVEGAHYLRIRDPQGGTGALVFETTSTGIVERWRVGVVPQIDYVEGCG